MISFANIPRKKTNIITFGIKEIGPYYWVGKCKNGINYYAGQTFKAPATGLLKRIKIFSSLIFGPSVATLSVYKFDSTVYQFKAKQSECTRGLTKAHENQWLEFDLQNLNVKKDAEYAFKLKCSGGGMVAIAECPWNTPNPYADGVEWVGSSIEEDGGFHKDFGLAFEGEIDTSVNAQFI